jgi:hypothetical protein
MKMKVDGDNNKVIYLRCGNRKYTNTLFVDNR